MESQKHKYLLQMFFFTEKHTTDMTTKEILTSKRTLKVANRAHMKK
jgi:hypothetical protein